MPFGFGKIIEVSKLRNNYYSRCFGVRNINFFWSSAVYLDPGLIFMHLLMYPKMKDGKGSYKKQKQSG